MNQKNLIKTELPAYARDMKTNALVLQDRAALDKYESDKQKRKLEKNKMADLEDEVKDLRAMIANLQSAVEDLKKK